MSQTGARGQQQAGKPTGIGVIEYLLAPGVKFISISISISPVILRIDRINAPSSPMQLLRDHAVDG
ncbi:MAG: hypothetical protein RQ741_02615 [Wenzhouxiangellaceae bacterium]|nr:hypothetical protein [Wenzhouxiangellaceae bacterium]